MTAHTNFEFLARLALEFRLASVVIADKTYYKQLKDCLSGTGIEVHAGEQALCALASVPVAAFVRCQLVYSEIAELVDRALDRFLAVAAKKHLMMLWALIERSEIKCPN